MYSANLETRPKFFKNTVLEKLSTPERLLNNALSAATAAKFDRLNDIYTMGFVILDIFTMDQSRAVMTVHRYQFARVSVYCVAYVSVIHEW